MRASTWLAWIASFYAASLCLPALGNSDTSFLFGIVCLIYLPFACLCPAWWANPLLFVGCWSLALGNRRTALWCGLVASALGFSIMWVITGIEQLQIGYLFWMASLIGLAVAGSDRSRDNFKAAKASWMD